MKGILSKLSLLAFSILFLLAPTSAYAEGKEYDLFLKKQNGFEHEIKASNKEIMRPIESKDGYIRYSLEEGEYTIEETKRPEGYKKAPERTFGIPYKDADGKEHSILKITPEAGEKIEKDNILSQAGVIGPLFLIATVALIAVGFMTLKKRR